jgi:phosphatidylglycerophosphatase A
VKSTTDPTPGGQLGDRLAALIATVLGVGYSPWMPGTMGTLAAVPLAYAVMGLGQPALWVTTVVVTLLGTWAAGRFCRLSGQHDNQRIVIDEVAGYLLTLALVPRTAANLVLAFVLFRVLDIAKPGPIRLVDRHVKGGFGVMADDLLAGLVGAVVLRLVAPYLPALVGPSLGGPL